MELFNQYKRNKRPVVICIHGFGRRKTVEYDNLLKAICHDYDVVLPELFDQRRADDIHWFNWVSRAEEKIIECKNRKREIVLIGFSMGGVIASYLASKFNIKRLILLAPAFEYLNLTTVKGQFKPKKSDPNDDRFIPLPSTYYGPFMDVVNNCKESISSVKCPVLFIHCMGDEMIPYSLSLKNFEKVPHDDKNCVILAKGQHRILDDEGVKDIAIELIKNELKKAC
ncbi:MAG: alpha/beta fold hydrolase [Erysipelotrichaceae bacterium]|nr:alpha/beta fold hydrolase [Erysipelotrichaceae bacterium]